MSTEDGTFPATGIDFDSRPSSPGSTVPGPAKTESLHITAAVDMYKIPAAVNFIALRESLLSEAPFIKAGSKGTWRRLIDGAPFQNMLGCVYSILERNISHSGALDVGSMRSMENMELFVMGKNFSDMFYKYSRHDRDAFLPKLPETLTYMVVNCLHTGNSKHYRMYNSFRFREILLDLFAELTGGLRLTDSRAGRDWLFADCADVPIFLKKQDDKFAPNPAVSSASSRFPLQNSPLIARYMGPHLADTYADSLGVTMTLGHLPERPLLTLREELEEKCKIGKPRHKKFNSIMCQKTLALNNKITTGIKDKQESNKKEMRKVI